MTPEIIDTGGHSPPVVSDSDNIFKESDLIDLLDKMEPAAPGGLVLTPEGYMTNEEYCKRLYSGRQEGGVSASK